MSATFVQIRQTVLGRMVDLLKDDVQTASAIIDAKAMFLAARVERDRAMVLLRTFSHEVARQPVGIQRVSRLIPSRDYRRNEFSIMITPMANVIADIVVAEAVILRNATVQKASVIARSVHVATVMVNFDGSDWTSQAVQ